MGNRDAGGRSKTHIDLEVLVNVVVHDKTVGQADPMRLHGMPSDIRVVANVGVVEVGHLLLGSLDSAVEGTITVDASRILGPGRAVHGGRS